MKRPLTSYGTNFYQSPFIHDGWVYIDAIHRKPSSHMKGHFTQDTESPWPVHIKHSHGSKFTSHYAWGTNRVCECKMDVKVYMDSYMASNRSCFMVTWTIFKNLTLGGRPHTKSGDHGTPKSHNCWFILFYHVWGPTLIEIHCNNIWLRVRSHMTLHYTWESVTTLRHFGGVLGRPVDTFFWALTILWSRLLARVWSGPHAMASFIHIEGRYAKPFIL